MSRVDINSLASPRIPKLQVRNRTPLDQASILTTSSGEPKESEDPDAITSIVPRDENPLRHSTGSSSSRLNLERKPSATTTLASNVSSSVSKSPKKGKKKGPSVFGFLTLKEPSQTALEQFAERTRQQAAEKAGSHNMGRISAVGLPGVSTQKLPPTVPKVNSKWDGIPESVKAKEAAQRKSISMSKRGSQTLEGTYSTRFMNHSNGSFNPPHSLASSAGSLKNAQRPPSLTPSVSSSGSGQRDLVLRYANRPVGIFDPAAAGLKTRASLTSPSMSSLPEISYFFPSDAHGPSGATEGTPPDNQPMTPKDLSLDTTSKDSKVVSTSVDDVAWVARSPTLVDFSTDSKIVDTQTIMKRISLNQGFLAGEAQEVVLPDEDDESVLGPPSVVDDTASEVNAEPLLNPESTTGMEPTAGYLLLTNEPAPTGELETVLEAIEPGLELSKLKDSRSESKDSPVADTPAIPTKNPNRYSSPTSPASTRTNFSRPLSYQPPLETKVPSRPSSARTILPTSSLDTPTILEATTTDEAVVNVAPSNRNNHFRQYSIDDTASIADSVAASSIAPSEMSARWFQSPRERLGLGGRIKKNDVLPWEMGLGERDAADRKNSKRNRLSLFGKSAA
ncbi:uncharacterized protein BDZ99DRAFT_500839 [Mytilinidion resinicola]|uniref:Uncharacterized protein n=1 Tax=Mytilinidion resinicola TaxID=574789 RepID=A0A6A6YDG8_9PEZI|nr:uncharacterized protein BDZ99DRAFT_500839 [Mytilinidion resinicola]KAF2806770.1 hypothetical protein BDZ99DRAFT_500839 [Mytilinidion resinicola]